MLDDHQTWFLLPDALMPPDGPLRLGTILSSPRDLDSVVCRGPAPAPEDVISSTKNHYQYSERRKLGSESKVMSSFLNAVLGLHTGRERSETISMACKSLDTTQFFPSAEYVGTCLTNEAARTWIKSHSSRRPLYMVTGIQRARGAEIKSERLEGSDFDLGGGVAVGIPLGMSVGLLDSPLGTTAVSGLSSATFSNDFVFAYKLRKLKISETKKLIRSHTLEAKGPSQPSTTTGPAIVPGSGLEGRSVIIVAGTAQALSNKAPGSAHARGETSETSERTFIVSGQGEDDRALQVQDQDVDTEEIDRPLRILSLDGGGVRGISSVLLLKDVMDEIANEEEKKRREKAKKPADSGNDAEGSTEGPGPIQPCGYFDLICGTSTGGLIAIMLGRLGFTVDDCITQYRIMAERIFGSKSKKPDVLYDARVLEACVEEAIKKAGLTKDTMLDNRDSPVGCRTFVVATATLENGAEPFLLRSYKANAEIPSPFKCTILEACRATSAAPSFFDPMHINGMTFGEKTKLRNQKSQPTRGDAASDGGGDLSLSDGGLTANNPAFEALFEIEKIPGWGRRLAAVVSIGTGKGTPPKLTRSSGVGYKLLGMFSQWQALRLDVAKYCADLVTDTEATHARVLNGLRTLKIEDVYFRLNAPEVGEFEMDKWQKMPDMERLTLAYVQKNADHKKTREKLAKILPDPEYARDQMLNERYGYSWVVPTTEACFVSSLKLSYFAQSTDGVDGVDLPSNKPKPPSTSKSQSEATNGRVNGMAGAKTANGDAVKSLDADTAPRIRIPWTWPLRNNQVPTIQSMIFYNYDDKTKSTWNHKGHKRKDQSVLTDRRDEGESAVAVLEMTTDVSFVSSRFVRQWKIKTHNVPEILRNKKILINGVEVHCDKMVNLSFRCAGFGMETQRTWFRVLDTDEVEVVFGSNAFDRSAFGRGNAV